MAQTIRAAQVKALGTDPVVCQVPFPVPALGQVLVRMGAAALNFADLLQAQGKYQEHATPPFVPGLEGAGTVISAPRGSELPVGSRVAVSAPGTFAEVMAVDPAAVHVIPDGMSFKQAAGFQVAYGTSHLALTARGALHAGETLAVLGAAGGVGLTAVEIGSTLGARVIGIARGAERLAAVTAAGAVHVIDGGKIPDLRHALRELGGVDVVYDAVGGEAGEAAFRALRPGGRFLAIGFAGGRPPSLPLNHALVKNIAIHGVYWGGYRQLDPLILRDSMASLFALFEAGRLRPVTGHVLPLKRINDGFALLRERRSTGKVVITL